MRNVRQAPILRNWRLGTLLAAGLARSEMVTTEDERKRILAVGLDRLTFGSFEALLSRARFDVDRVSSTAGGLALCQGAKLDLVLVSHPLSGMSLAEFVHTLRAIGSASAKAELLVLAPAAELATARRQLPAGDGAVLSVTEPRLVLQEMAARLLDVAPRRDARLAVRLRVGLESGEEMRFCQTENVSVAGLLVRTQPPPPIGTPLTFELTLPGEREPIRGRGEVARHTVANVEGVIGVGVRVDGFAGNGRQQLETYLNNLGAWD
jgi:CheY-like chemotaxis protein